MRPIDPRGLGALAHAGANESRQGKLDIDGVARSRERGTIVSERRGNAGLGITEELEVVAVRAVAARLDPYRAEFGSKCIAAPPAR
jgi:hypothetical protein